MAFVDKDEDGDRFANLTLAVGPGRANLRDDVALVQLLLIGHFATGGKIKGRPQTTSVDLGKIVLGTYDDDTGTLISDFQRAYLNRPKPEGYIQPATGKKKSRYTIWQLYSRMQVVLVLAHDPRANDVVEYLRAFPSLGSSLRQERQSLEVQTR